MPSSKEGQASITIRCTEEQRELIKKKAEQYGFESYADYIRFVSLNAEVKVKVKESNKI